MPFVEAINAYDVSFKNNVIPRDAFSNLVCLRNFVFPKVLKIIRSFAFAGTQLEGDLIIPEGVHTIEDYAFVHLSSMNILKWRII